jgi:hypothetical protein
MYYRQKLAAAVVNPQSISKTLKAEIDVDPVMDLIEKKAATPSAVVQVLKQPEGTHLSFCTICTIDVHGM